MLGHLGINVADLSAAKAYYDQLVPLLDFEEFVSTEDQFAYRPVGKPGTIVFFYPALESAPYCRHLPGLQHLAFMVPTRSAVRVVHEHVVRTGGTVVHEPQEWPDYPPPYYATFWLDPFGVLLEAVCHKDVE